MIIVDAVDEEARVGAVVVEEKIAGEGVEIGVGLDVGGLAKLGLGQLGQRRGGPVVPRPVTLFVREEIALDDLPVHVDR